MRAPCAFLPYTRTQPCSSLALPLADRCPCPCPAPLTHADAASGRRCGWWGPVACGSGQNWRISVRCMTCEAYKHATWSTVRSTRACAAAWAWASPPSPRRVIYCAQAFACGAPTKLSCKLCKNICIRAQAHRPRPRTGAARAAPHETPRHIGHRRTAHAGPPPHRPPPTSSGPDTGDGDASPSAQWPPPSLAGVRRATTLHFAVTSQ